MKTASYLAIFTALILITATSITFSKGPGDKAEDFTLSSTEGKSYNLTTALESSSNGVVVIFWSIECPWVQPYNDRINDYAKKLNEQGFTVWLVNSNSTESLEEVTAYTKKNKYSFPTLKDVNNVVADMFGATRTPEAFMMAKDKTILYHGRISDNKSKSEQTVYDLGNAAGEVSSGKEVTVKETKSFGCGIKKIGQDN